MEDIAEQVSHPYGKTVSPDNVQTLIEDKLRPLGVLAASDGTSPPVETSNPLLALKLRRDLVGCHGRRSHHGDRNTGGGIPV